MSSAETSSHAPTLGVAIITRNAEHLLASTLESVRDVAQQIVVLDTGSDDATAAVAEQTDAELHRAEWHDDFSAARNACAKLVKTDWLLWLDSGETLSATAAGQIKRFIAEDADPFKAYMLFVQLPPAAANLSSEQIGQIRLIPTATELRFAGRVRESLLDSVLAAGMDIDALPCQIARPLDDLSVDRKQAKAQRNLEILELAVEEVGASPILNLVRGEACQVLERKEEAATHYRRTIELANRGSSEMLEGYYGLLTTFDDDPDKAESQIATCLEALDIFPLDAQLLCGMGSYLIKQGRLDLASRSYELAATHGQVDPATWHLADIGEVASSCLALTHQLQDQYDQAQQHLQDALLQRPASVRLRRQLIELHIQLGNQKDTLEQFNLLPKEVPNREALKSAVRGALLAGQKNWLAAEPYLKTALRAGCHDALCLRWLVVCYLALGRWDDAQTTLGTWRTYDPASAEIVTYEQALAERRPSEKDVRETAETAVSSPTSTGGDRQVRIDQAGRHAPTGSPTNTPSVPMTPHASGFSDTSANV